ncbi:hypothetical protein [Bradyrhizobium sp.]|uniref:hypothetical protein n=1 Tax=Bradyrhizobium sp. TaxID=376 RepID=UPI002D73AA05|nr:hypothetical protein [Bradyrhizobium sp.]HZR77008.1 hypothetical protein [Bradyrhizobium sp.]
MELKVATVLVGNLVERLERNDYKLEGSLTEREKVALQELLSLARNPAPPTRAPSTESAPVAPDQSDQSSDTEISKPAIAKTDLPTSKFDLNTRALTQAPDRDITLCLDFGTAYSKAAFWDTSKEIGDPDDGANCCRALPIGRQAGETGFVYPVSSSVYVCADGTIYFGPAAVAASIRDNDPRHSRFENPKEYLSKPVGENFYTQVLPPEFDPTGSGLTYYEVLQAYLAYLTSHTNQAAKQSGCDGLLRRRFAIPNWTGDKSEFVKKEMRRILLNAQVLADSVDPDLWSKGHTVEFLREAVRQTQKATARADSSAIEHAIYESTAAASGAVAKLRNSKDIFLVADIGAGTCDLGLYYAVSPAARTDKPIKFASLCDARDVVNRGGRFFDDQLRNIIIDKLGIDSGGPESHRLRPLIDREIQNLKHLLFQTGECRTLLDGQTITVTLEEFEQRNAIQQFVQMFSNSVRKLLRAGGAENFAAKHNRVRCVLTGGGSATPFIRRLFERPMQVDESNIAFSIVDPTPAWVEAGDEALFRTYPQMAVAMGGCDPSLPQEVQAIRDITKPTTIVRVGSIADGYRVSTKAT